MSRPVPGERKAALDEAAARYLSGEWTWKQAQDALAELLGTYPLREGGEIEEILSRLGAGGDLDGLIDEMAGQLAA